MKNQKERISLELGNKIARISSHGLVLVITTFLGLYLGIYLDRVTGMAPNFTIVLFIVGVILGFKGFVQETILERRQGT